MFEEGAAELVFEVGLRDCSSLGAAEGREWGGLVGSRLAY